MTELTIRQALVAFTDPEVEAAYADCPHQLQQTMRVDVLRQKLVAGLVVANGFLPNSAATPTDISPALWEGALVVWDRDLGNGSATLADGRRATGLRFRPGPRFSAPTPTRRAGPKRVAEARVQTAMLADLDAGKVTIEALLDEKLTTLASRYDVSASTARRALKAVAEFVRQRAG